MTKKKTADKRRQEIITEKRKAARIQTRPEIEMLAVDRLVPYAKNAKKHDDRQVAAIAGSIREFGFTNPVLIDGQDGIIAGHGRVLAAQKLGLASVPCIRLAHLTDAQRRAYIIADNRLAETGGGWDAAMLAAEVEAIDWAELDAFKLDDMDLGEILAEAERGSEGDADAEAQVDRAAELNKKWGVKPGDLYQIGEHRLLCGDSTKAEDVARVLNESPVSMIHADPPYFGKVDEAWDNDFGGYEQFLDFLDSVFALWIPKTMDRGTSAWWCAPDFAWHIEERLRKYAAVFNHIVWTKGKSLGTTVSVKDMRRWRPRSERLLLCEKQHSPDALLASFNAKTAHIAARSAYSSIIDRLVGWLESSGLSLKQIDACLGTNGMGGHYFGRSQWALPTKEAWDKLRPLFSSKGVDIGEWDAQRAEFDAQRREFNAETADNLTDVWEMSAPTGEDRPNHPTPKPLALVSKLLSAHARPGDLIADPFLGSGTTMVAAQNLSRKCYGLEISPSYCAVILQRMADAFPGIDIRKADA